MFFRKGIFLLLTGLALGFPAADAGAMDNFAAQDLKHRVDFRLGLYSPEAGDVESFDPGLHAEVAYSRYFHPNFGLEAGLGYFVAERSSGTLDQRVSDTFLSLSAVGRLPVDVFEFSAFAGVSGNFTRIEETVPGSSATDEGISFGYHVGGGLDWNFTPEYFLGLHGRYFWLETDGTNVDLDGVLVSIAFGFRL